MTIREDGRLRVAVFRPLDSKSVDYLINLAQTCDHNLKTNQSERFWGNISARSQKIGNFYAADRGEAYLSFWEKGIGMNGDGTENATYRPYKDLSPRRAIVVLKELSVHRKFSSKQELGSSPKKEKPRQPAKPVVPPWHSKRQQSRTIRDRFLGCLLGGAVGDALGAPVEFMKRTEILNRFGPDGITAYAPAYGGLGTITDDT
jgi:hypothetical protein